MLLEVSSEDAEEDGYVFSQTIQTKKNQLVSTSFEDTFTYGSNLLEIVALDRMKIKKDPFRYNLYLDTPSSSQNYQPYTAQVM